MRDVPTVIGLLLLLGAAACSGNESSPGKLDTGVHTGADRGTDITPPDQTVAKPDTKPDTMANKDQSMGKKLTKTHSGWKKALCFDCHDGTKAKYTHAMGKYRAPDCNLCHGYNGAPHKIHATKSNKDCLGCHPASKVAHVAKFTAPDDCESCHYHP